jgi:endonuclease/exonuclease/phosphatase (EEP) superfamily protein YafD
MKFLALIASGLIAQMCLAGALLGILGLGGGWNGWLDVIAAFAPWWVALSAVGGVLAFAALVGEVKRQAAICALVGVVAGVLLMAPELLRSAGPVGLVGRAPPLKLLTFNTWDDNRDVHRTVDDILATGADVVAMQELGDFSPAERARLRAVYPEWAPCPPMCDLALLSKRPWTDVGSETAGGEEAFALYGRTTAPDGRPVEVLTTHYAWPAPPRRQSHQRAELASLVAKLAGSPDLIVAGDFNLAPWTSALKRQDGAFKPLTRRTRAVFSWPANVARLYVPFPFPLLPIDQIYAAPAWRTVALKRLPRSGSDHYGVTVTLARPG